MATTEETTKVRKPLRGVLVGVVASDKRTKTRTVHVNFQAQHTKYGKLVKHRSVLQVHDEKNESRQGDRVEIAPCRRLSKTKSWRLLRVVETAPVGDQHVTE